MKRVRISTTVDAEQLAACRRLLPESDSRILDRALAALIDELEGARELAVLEAHPYDEDADLGWTAPEAPDLPYDGDVPPDVVRLAAERRSVG